MLKTTHNLLVQQSLDGEIPPQGTWEKISEHLSLVHFYLIPFQRFLFYNIYRILVEQNICFINKYMSVGHVLNFLWIV